MWLCLKANAEKVKATADTLKVENAKALDRASKLEKQVAAATAEKARLEELSLNLNSAICCMGPFPALIPSRKGHLGEVMGTWGK